MIILGIDPGLAGGMALLETGPPRGLLALSDIPTTGEKTRRRVDARQVLAFILSHRPDHAVIERAGVMPKQGIATGFRYGRAVGALEACVEGCAIPLTIIEPAAWKKTHGLIGKDKEDSRQRALQLFPSHAGQMARRGDHGRAEAALMAWYGAMLLRSEQVNAA